MLKDDFINPIPKSKVKETSTKTVKLVPTDSNKVVSPYKGTIIDDDKISICGGEKDKRFIIRHRVGGKYFYSIICNVNKDPFYITTNSQINVSKGDVIGDISNDKDAYYTILDDNSNEVVVDSFLSLSNNKDKEENKKEIKKDKNKKDKENKGNTENTTNGSSSSSRDSIAKDWLVGVPSELFKLGTMAFRGNPEKKEKEETSENVKLKEEIERIKILLK
jgi:hypothetical protein